MYFLQVDGIIDLSTQGVNMIGIIGMGLGILSLPFLASGYFKSFSLLAVISIILMFAV
jgi:hypothetical protein